jgi:hypothetical protein
MNNMEQRHPMVSVVSVAIGIAVVVAFLLRSTTAPQTRAEETVPQQSRTATYPILRSASGLNHSKQQDMGEQLDIILKDADYLARLNKFKSMLAQWTTEDQEAALAYVRAMKIGPEHSAGLLIVLQAIGRSDTERAILLANEMVKDQEQAAVYSSLFATATANDISRALRDYALVPAGQGRENALRALTGKWAGTDAEATLGWANSLADERERDIARESAIDALLASDPTRAIDLAQKNLTGDAREEICSTAIRHLCAQNPEVARDAFSRLDAENQQPFTATEVARALAGQDMPSAIAWADTMPDGASRDAVVNLITRLTTKATQ